MRTVYLLSVYAHLLAALLWLGGMLFLALVVLPTLRGSVDPATRARLLAVLGLRFRGLGWAAIALLLVTGLVNALGRWGAAALLNPRFWQSGPGQLLAAKLGLVAAMLALAAWHDFRLGPRLAALDGEAAGAGAADPARRAGLRRQTLRLARLEALLGLLVLALAVLIVRPG